MRDFASNRLPSLPAIWLAAALVAVPAAATAQDSGFGAIAIPAPARPAQAENCVEPVEVMRREHMQLLVQQRDRTVIDGERNGKYSLVGCMDCHNPVTPGGEAASYGEPDHFCTACHAYTSVEIDCFECHADRGYGQQESGVSSKAFDDGARLTAATLQLRLEADSGD